MTTSGRVLISLFIFSTVVAQFEGDRCKVKSSGGKGKCVVLDDCDYAKDLLRTNQRPQHCGFKGFIPVVCCPLTSKLAPGQKSEKQCGLYYPKPLTYKTLVFGGVQSLAKEFPHMAILGYGDKNDIQWLCGGSLISEEFVLTAAHCVISAERGFVRWVRLGDLDIKNTTDDARPQNFTVVSTFVHPEYKSTSHYHDIALIKLNKSSEFNDYVRPACLHTARNITAKLIVTGWGKTDFLGEASSHLMKADVDYIRNEECSKRYENVSKRKLGNGIVDDLQVCAGSPEGKDTCPGDSGGPLQFKVTTPVKHYYVVGITSFGKGCGVANSAGVYTRVAQYVDWIEDIVWALE